MRVKRLTLSIPGSAMAWPVAVWARQPDRMRRIGVLAFQPRGDERSAGDDPDGVVAFVQGLQELGWTDGRNVRIWVRGNAERIRKYAAGLVALGPDVILATGNTTLGPLFQATRRVRVCRRSGRRRLRR